MSRKEKKQNTETVSPEILLARILALRAMLSNTISDFMDMVGRKSNVVGTESVTIKLIGKKHDNYIMFTPWEKGDIKFGDLRAFSGYNMVDDLVTITNDWSADGEVSTVTSMTVEHVESPEIEEWDKGHVQFMCDLSNRRAIDELLRRGMYED